MHQRVAQRGAIATDNSIRLSRPAAAPSRTPGPQQTTGADRRAGFDFSAVPIHPYPALRIQAKLTVGHSDDPLEHEADRIADQVMRMPEPETQRNNLSDFSRAAQPAPVQAKSAGDTGAAGIEAPPIVHDVLRSPGRPLDAATRAFFEPRFGRDFGAVRVHSSVSAAMLNAQAFTVGDRITFHPSYTAQSGPDRRLLAHELTHTIQQGSSASADRVAQRFLADQTKTDDKVKTNYFKLVDKGSDHYIEAIRYLVTTYKIDASHAELTYDPKMTGAYAITGGNVGDPCMTVRFGPLCFDKSQDFGVVCRAVAHEIIHTKQKSIEKLSDHSEREFLAYYDTLSRKDMPAITNEGTLQFFVKKALSYYAQLSPEKQKQFASKKKVIDDIKTKNGW